MRYLFTFLICVLLISVSSCRKNFDTIPSFGNLEFSKDTVFLDTIFTNIGSATYNLKVYNRGEPDSRRNVVDLPHPDGPSKATKEPRAMSSETFSTPN